MASRFSKALAAVFQEYGDDAEAGLLAFANTANEEWDRYTDSAAVKQYRQDYRRWIASFDSEAQPLEVAGDARLFDPGPRLSKAARIREYVIHDGLPYRVADLAGDEGAAILKSVALRDAKPARTAIGRSKYILSLAEHMLAESVRLGRDVSAGEVLGWAA